MGRELLFICTGSILGGVLRYLFTVFISVIYQGTIPIVNLFINFFGCLFLGIFIGLSKKYEFISPEFYFFFITGFCASFTTFSAFSLDNYHLLLNGQIFSVFLYSIASVLLGITGIYLGVLIEKI